MSYTVADSEIIAESLEGADDMEYIVRRYSTVGRYDGQLVICEAFDVNASYADFSVEDEDGATFADYFRAPFHLDTLEEGPTLLNSETQYLETFTGARLYYASDGSVSLKLFKDAESMDVQYQSDIESALS